MTTAKPVKKERGILTDFL